MNDDIVGLQLTDGRVWLCPRSTLAFAGGYFAAFSPESELPVKALRTNEHGHSIYFIARDGELFGKHILPYILTKKAGKLPPFSEDPELWRLLREEAEFFGLEDLSDMLNITHTCKFSIGSDRGILYWLGTEKGKSEYKNPQAIGMIEIHVGKLGDSFNEYGEFGVDIIPPQAFTQKSREALVQYRPPIVGDKGSKPHNISIGAFTKCYSLWCGMSLHRIPTIVDLRSVTLRLTSYSLRYDKSGMTDWNLEASGDGKDWTILHEARNDRHLARMDADMMEWWIKAKRACKNQDSKLDFSQEFAERKRRHVWHIDPPPSAFFRYFRIIGSGTNYERHEDAVDCLHGTGLELYGDIHED